MYTKKSKWLEEMVLTEKRKHFISLKSLFILHKRKKECYLISDLLFKSQL